MQTFLPVSSLWSSNSEEIWRVVYSVSAAVPAPQQLEEGEVMKSATQGPDLLNVFCHVVNLCAILVSHYRALLRWETSNKSGQMPTIKGV